MVNAKKSIKKKSSQKRKSELEKELFKSPPQKTHTTYNIEQTKLAEGGETIEITSNKTHEVISIIEQKPYLLDIYNPITETKIEREFNSKEELLQYLKENKLFVYFIENPNLILSTDAQKIMFIRVLDADKQKWIKFNWRKGKEGWIFTRSENDTWNEKQKKWIVHNKKATYFLTLDIGEIGKKDIDRSIIGIAFVWGFPRGLVEYSFPQKPVKIGEVLDKTDMRAQSIRIEYAKLGLEEFSASSLKIEKVLNQYSQSIIDFLNRQFQIKLKSIHIIEKEGDFQLITEPPLPNVF